jgi:hypothetical protein
VVLPVRKGAAPHTVVAAKSSSKSLHSLSFLSDLWQQQRNMDDMEGVVAEASFVSTGSIPIGMDKYNKKIMIVTIRDPDLFRVEN